MKKFYAKTLQKTLELQLIYVPSQVNLRQNIGYMLRKFFLVFLVLFLVAAVTIVVCGIYLYNSYLQKELISIINEVDIAAFSKDIDLSTDKTVQCKQNMTGNVWLISYADGSEVHLANQRTLTASALNKCIDFYKPYNRKHIASSYVSAHENVFSHKKGAGYWLWKPYIILETLEEIPENDILLYADRTGVKNEGIWDIGIKNC